MITFTILKRVTAKGIQFFFFFKGEYLGVQLIILVIPLLIQLLIALRGQKLYNNVVTVWELSKNCN